MRSVVVPAALRAALAAAHGPAGLAWCDRLPESVAGYAARWGVPVEAPFPATYHWVAPAGPGAVLEVGYPSPERVHPGTDLLDAPDEEAFPLMAAVARALHTAGHARPGLAVDAGALVDLRTGYPDLPASAAGPLPRRPAPRQRAAVRHRCRGDRPAWDVG
jgi:streptomycin 6-kinase